MGNTEIIDKDAHIVAEWFENESFEIYLRKVQIFFDTDESKG